MRAHAHDLRAEVADFDITDEYQADQFVHAVSNDWHTAGLNDIDQALCRFADKLTANPAGMIKKDVDLLKSAGLTDQAIHDAVQVISYFNYINRVADALDVHPESFVRAWEDPQAFDKEVDP